MTTSQSSSRTRTSHRARKRSAVVASSSTTDTIQPWGVIGNQPMVSHLQRMIANGRLTSHAFLFIGPRGLGKTSLANAFAQAVVCHHARQGIACGDCVSCAAFLERRHPDVHTITPADGSIGVEAARTLRRSTERRPMLASTTVIIIDQAETMTEEASNALLKTLEEPSGNTILLLTAAFSSRLPATILSRCSRYHLTAVSEQTVFNHLLKHGVKADHARDVAAFSDGRPAYALLLASQPTLWEQAIAAAEQLPDIVQAPLHRRLQAAAALAQTYDDSEKIQSLLERWMSIAHRMLRGAAGITEHGPLATRSNQLGQRLGFDGMLKLSQTLMQAYGRSLTSSNIRLTLEACVLGLPSLP